MYNITISKPEPISSSRSDGKEWSVTSHDGELLAVIRSFMAEAGWNDWRVAGYEVEFYVERLTEHDAVFSVESARRNLSNAKTYAREICLGELCRRERAA